MKRSPFAVARPVVTVALAALSLAGCGGDGVSSEGDAQRAYQGLDTSVDTAIKLGFDGFNAAMNANIPAQTAKGMVSGTMTISGQVDAGASSNKTMNLSEQLVKFSDDGKLTYDAAAVPISMKLNMIPTGTLSGTLGGTYVISGDLKGMLTLSLSFTGDLQAGTGGAMVERKPGTTHITGTATSDYGVYNVELTR